MFFPNNYIKLRDGLNVKNVELPKLKDSYKNIFEMRDVKMRFLMNDMPKIVKNFYLIKLEDLQKNYKYVLNEICCKFHLHESVNDVYPKNYDTYTKSKLRKSLQKYKLNKNDVYLHKSLVVETEKQMGYLVDQDRDN